MAMTSFFRASKIPLAVIRLVFSADLWSREGGSACLMAEDAFFIASSCCLRHSSCSSCMACEDQTTISLPSPLMYLINLKPGNKSPPELYSESLERSPFSPMIICLINFRASRWASISPIATATQTLATGTPGLSKWVAPQAT